MVKGKPHTGLCYYPTKVGRMHRGLKGYDFFGDMVKTCHETGIAVIAYFTQIFDNWAYEEHPPWRLVTAEGKMMREYRHGEDFKLSLIHIWAWQASSMSAAWRTVNAAARLTC